MSVFVLSERERTMALAALRWLHECAQRETIPLHIRAIASGPLDLEQLDALGDRLSDADAAFDYHVSAANPSLPIRCPVCGNPPHATVDLIPGSALVAISDDGTADYIGETIVDWNAQITVKSDGRALLECENDHVFTHPAFVVDA